MLLIDIKKPKVCAECPMFYTDSGDGEYTFLTDGCNLLHKRFNKWVYNGEHLIDPDEERFSECPLVEVIKCKECVRYEDSHSFCYRFSGRTVDFCSKGETFEDYKKRMESDGK